MLCSPKLMEALQIIQPSVPGKYARFWLRFCAALLDSLILFMPFVVITYFVGLTIGIASIGTINDRATLMIVILPPVITLVTWLYFALLENSSWQGTIGKKILRLYVTDSAGNRLRLARATGRNLSKCLSSTTAGVGYAMCGFTKKKQVLHDIVAKCLVLRHP